MSSPQMSSRNPNLCQVSDQPLHDASSEKLDVNQAELDQEKAPIPPGIDDILTKSKFFETMNKFQEDLLKPI